MSLKQKAIKGVVWTAIGSWGGQLISFLVFFLLARLLGPEAFGLVALANIFFAFVQIFLDQGFGQAIIQRQNLEREHLDTAFWTSTGIGVFLTVLCFAAAGLIANLFNQPLLTPVIQWMSLNFAITGLNSVQGAILGRDLGFKTLTIRSLIATAVGGVVGVVMALQGYGVWSLVGQSLANSVAGVITLWSTTVWRPRLSFSSQHFRELFAYGINVIGISVLNFFNRRSDDFLIGYFLGPVALGYYSVAYRMLTITSQLLIKTMQGTSMPVFSRLQQEPDRLRRAFYDAIKMTNLIAFPGFLFLSLLAPELVMVVFGAKWQPSIPVMQILGLVGFLQAGFFYNGPLLMALGKPDWNLKLNCFQAICNVVSFLIAVRWGIVAVAAAYVIRGYLTSPITVWVVNKALPISLVSYLQQYTGPLAGVLAMTVTILGCKYFLSAVLDVHLQLVIYIIVGLATYIATISLVAPALFQEAVNLSRLVVASKIKKSA